VTQPVRHGDPDAMRAVASAWAARAEQLADLGAAISRTIHASGFEGPAALRVGEQAGVLGRESLDLAGALQAQAQALRVDADTVEAMNADAVRAAEAEQTAAATTHEPAP
jgi:uncharacterized protein YukE